MRNSWRELGRSAGEALSTTLKNVYFILEANEIYIIQGCYIVMSFYLEDKQK